MATPLVEQIAQAIVNRIRGVSTIAGYQTDLEEVIRPTRLGTEYSPKHKQVVVLQSESERLEEMVSSGSQLLLHYRQTFVVRAHAMPEENVNVPVSQVVNGIIADVCKAICTNPSGEHWWTWGGLAINSELQGPQAVDESDGSVAGMEIPLVVDYRHAENDPYTAA